MKQIAIGSDHAGYEMKQGIIAWLNELGYDVTDHGTNSADSVDYPDFAHAVSLDVVNGKCEVGIVLCGSANGVSMSANKHAAIRCALCWNEEISQLARQHNDANVLAIPARFVTEEGALAMVQAFLNTSFEGGRHQRRVEKIAP
ncbi:MAG: ribose 5-phosphate isomerase B [Cryomorphaceae bacterium]|nr:MAG: ribose 5-phosphate isomerase B [Cryomorphaceae bacterium]